jgi:2-oxo-3-hexenedioate decarboxylase
MDEDALLGCIDWIAHGFEIVQSVYPGWKLTRAEAAAAFGLHGALILGSRHDITADRAAWGAMMSNFPVLLMRNGAVTAAGHARQVLGGPLAALRFLMAELARYPKAPPLEAGEIVTTGTLTDAQPLGPGEVWTTELDGIPIRGLRLAIR